MNDVASAHGFRSKNHIRCVLEQDTFLSQGFSALGSEMGTRELVGEI